MGKIRILVADDHTLVRQGLRQICEAEEDMLVVGEAADGEEACRLALSMRPDIVLMDIKMPNRDGVEATRWITTKNPNVKVIILTMYRREDYLFEAIKAGAKGYLLKDADSQELLQAIRLVHQGEAMLDPGIAQRVLEEFRRLSQLGGKGEGAGLIHLTERERDILQLVAEGASNQEIAERLHLSEKTVRNRLSVIFDKLHVNNRTQAALYAMREGLTSANEELKAKAKVKEESG